MERGLTRRRASRLVALAALPACVAACDKPPPIGEHHEVTVALLPEGAGPDALEPLLPRIGEALLERLKDHARLRMAVTPPNKRLVEHLRQRDGFSLAVPSTYDASQPEPGVYVFRHEEEGLTPVIQGIAVDSRPRGAVDWTAEAAGEWRAGLAGRVNEPAHVTEALPRWHEADVAGQRTLHVQGVWSLPAGGWPGGGPFMSRLVECGDRVYLLDAWLYAPGDAKYELMVQLDIILDTFRCPAGPRDV